MKRHTFSIVVVLALVGCGKSPRVVGTANQAASIGIDCILKYDGACVGELVWQPEVDKTGLSSEAVAAVIEGVYKKATHGYVVNGQPKYENLDINRVYAEQEFKTPDGRRKGISLIASSGAEGGRLTSLSMCLFTALGNAEQRSGENHYAAWLRMLKANRSAFESLGWHGMLGDSSGGNYRDWDTVEVWLRREEDRVAKKNLAFKGSNSTRG